MNKYTRYDEMTLEELTEEQDLLLINLKDIENSLENIDKAINNLSGVDTDIINNVYTELEDIRNVLDEEITGIKIDLEEIESCMAILEDTFDDYTERMKEYREMQGF